jgi:hypothetical protein
MNGRHARRKQASASNRTGVILGAAVAVAVAGIAALAAMRGNPMPPVKTRSALQAHEDEAIPETTLTQEVESEQVATKPARVGSATHEDTIGYWRFEDDGGGGGLETVPSDASADAMVGTVRGKENGGLISSTEVPADYAYDPLTGRSSKNNASIVLTPASDAGAYIQIPFSPDEGPTGGMSSFTLEMFVKPAKATRRLETPMTWERPPVHRRHARWRRVCRMDRRGAAY